MAELRDECRHWLLAHCSLPGCREILWGDAVGSVGHDSHASALLSGGIGFPLLFSWEGALPQRTRRLSMGSAQRTLWAATHTASAPPQPHFCTAAGQTHTVSLYGCASSRERALGSPAYPCTLLPARTAHLPASPGLVLASLSSLQLCCSMSGTRVHCLHPLHKPCCRRTGSPISQLQPRANTQKLGMDGRTPISRLFPSTGPCSQHHQCDHGQGMQLPRSQRPAQLLS